jgi:uncharacterized protein
MTHIGLLSDTHNYLDDRLLPHIANVDELWHAGDIGNIDLLNKLEQLKPTRAVFGNIDDAEVRQATHEHLFFTIENVSVLMLHIGGYPPKYNKQSLQLIQQYTPQVMICGHSHIVKVIKDPVYNLLHLNPGACGKQGWHKVQSIMTLSIDKDKVVNLKLIEL